MKCREVLENLEEFVSDECHPSMADSVGAHVSVCTSCATKLDSLVTEREIFSRFLFEAEPSAGFGDRFFERLDAETEPVDSRIRSLSPGLLTVFLANLRPVFGIAAVVAVAIPAFLYFVSRPSARLPLAEVSAVEIPSPTMTAGELTPIVDETVPPAKDAVAQPKTEQAVLRSRSRKMPERPLSASSEKRERKNEELDPELADLRNFAADTTRQIENVEQLLRSFRNARTVASDGESEGVFDVSYERDLAARLLSRNFELRRRAEILRDPFAAELLDRVEPYLVEISNLDDSPNDEIVLAIKQRVRNRNVIASLQGF